MRLDINVVVNDAECLPNFIAIALKHEVELKLTPYIGQRANDSHINTLMNRDAQVVVNEKMQDVSFQLRAGHKMLYVFLSKLSVTIKRIDR